MHPKYHCLLRFHATMYCHRQLKETSNVSTALFFFVLRGTFATSPLTWGSGVLACPGESPSAVSQGEMGRLGVVIPTKNISVKFVNFYPLKKLKFQPLLCASLSSWPTFEHCSIKVDGHNVGFLVSTSCLTLPMRCPFSSRSCHGTYVGAYGMAGYVADAAPGKLLTARLYLTSVEERCSTQLFEHHAKQYWHQWKEKFGCH